MKKLWIGIAVGAGIMAAILLALFLLTPKVIDSGDTDSLYPYSYTVRKNGLDVTVSGQVPEGYSWTYDMGTSAAVSAEITDSGASKTVVALRTNFAGTVTLKLLLQKESDLLTDRIYELDIYLLADSNGELRVLDNTHREHPGAESGNLSGKDYTIAQLDDGRLAVQAQDPAQWTLSVEQENVGVYTERRLFYIEGFSQGEDAVLLYHKDSDEALRLALFVEGTKVNLVSVSRTAVPENRHSYTNLSLFTDLYGSPVLVEGAELLEADVQVRKSYTDPDMDIAVGLLTYDIDGQRWEMLYTGQDRLEDLICEMTFSKPNPKSGTVLGIEIQAYGNNQKAVAGCILEDGTAIMIQGEGFTSAQAYDRLGQFVTVLQHG